MSTETGEDQIIDALSTANIEYAICGGFAVNIHGHVRATRDVDVLIREESLDAALKAVAGRGFTLSSGRAQDLADIEQLGLGPADVNE